MLTASGTLSTARRRSERWMEAACVIILDACVQTSAAARRPSSMLWPPSVSDSLRLQLICDWPRFAGEITPRAESEDMERKCGELPCKDTSAWKGLLSLFVASFRVLSMEAAEADNDLSSSTSGMGLGEISSATSAGCSSSATSASLMIMAGPKPIPDLDLVSDRRAAGVEALSNLMGNSHGEAAEGICETGAGDGSTVVPVFGL
mmetsp:Transcript_76064/g.195952  ORF Transcript_76064/g.195952 Transcript_76064/m.195952 type:complete len:205 (-) Transcript_76064:432-1046(-)